MSSKSASFLASPQGQVEAHLALLVQHGATCYRRHPTRAPDSHIGAQPSGCSSVKDEAGAEFCPHRGTVRRSCSLKAALRCNGGSGKMRPAQHGLSRHEVGAGRRGWSLLAAGNTGETRARLSIGLLLFLYCSSIVGPNFHVLRPCRFPTTQAIACIRPDPARPLTFTIAGPSTRASDPGSRGRCPSGARDPPPAREFRASPTRSARCLSLARWLCS